MITKQINTEIYDTFAKTIVDIVKNSNTSTTFNLDYVAYVNNNILSLVIRCKYKNGSNPQRNIIQTYNYDVENNKLVDIRDENNEIYKIDNTPNFFLGKDNYLYLVYAYGNNNYTSETDLVIF